MSKGLSRWTRTSILNRDNFVCQKCKLEDKTGKQLEVHHIKPSYLDGSDEADNLITLCFICHKYAPNHQDEFKVYMSSECDGQLTTLLKILKEVQEPETFSNQK